MVSLISGTLAQSTPAPCDQLLYTPEAGYEEKHAIIYHDNQFKDLAEDIGCYLESLEIGYSKLIPIEPANPLLEFCRSSEIMNKTSKLHLTVTITEAFQIEEMCQNDVVLLHMKAIRKKWLAHIITPRSDVIIPLGLEEGGEGTRPTIELDSLLMVMETVAMLWGPVYFTPDKSKYKSMQIIVKALKSKLIIIPTLVVGMVFLVGVVGLISFYAKRKKETAEQKMLQKRKSLLLANWGDERFQGTPVWNIEEEHTTEQRSTNVSDGNREVDVTLEGRQRRGSNEVAISDTERSPLMDH
ncbi:hypothetical protein Y032_0032g2514 [Ancylostoma ceylanicum]|nr:hypothetical protein Y032_0032g2514 [Ancylostoma ceylanicum]